MDFVPNSGSVERAGGFQGLEILGRTCTKARRNLVLAGSAYNLAPQERLGRGSAIPRGPILSPPRQGVD